MEETWSLDRIHRMIAERVQEDLHLDYKAAAALSKEEKKKTEVSKDVSAFANADGGVIIYGVGEDSVDDSLPGSIDPVDARTFSVEWLEQIITSRIQPKIAGLLIQVLEVNPGQAVYIVEIPKGETAHQAHDKRYYKRLGRISEAMWDYEVRDVMNRSKTPQVHLEFTLVQSTRTRRVPRKIEEGESSFDIFSKGFYTDAVHTNSWLRIRARNRGEVMARFVNGFVTIDPPIGEKPFDDRPVELISEIYVDNKIPEILEIIPIPDPLGQTSYVPKHGRSVYEPLLPMLSLKLSDHLFDIDSVTDDTIIHWTTHADNAQMISGSVSFKDIKKEDI